MASVADGQRGPPLAESTATPTEDGVPWDAISSNYWGQVQAVRADEDSNLEANFRTQMDKLESQSVIRYEQRLQIIKKIQELQTRLEDLNHQDIAGEAKKGELTQALEAKRLAIANERKSDDDQKHLWFKVHRGNNTASATATASHNVNAGNTDARSPSIMTAPSFLTTPSTGSPVQNVHTPAEVSQKLVQANDLEVKLVQVTEIKAVAKVEVIHGPIPVHPVSAVEANDAQKGTDVVENGSEAENGDKPEQLAEVSDGTVGRDETPAPSGNGTAPQGNGNAPQGNGTAPQGNVTAPHGNGTAPQGNITAPHGNGTAPQGNVTAPHGNGTAPQSNGTAPQGDLSDPHGNGTAQKGAEAHNGVEVENTLDAPNASNIGESKSTAEPQASADVLETTEPRDTDVEVTAMDAPRGVEDGVDAMDVDDAMVVDAGVDTTGDHAQADREDTESSSVLTSAHSTPVPEPPGFHLEPEDQSKPTTPTDEHFDGVEVYDGSGELIGTVRHINLDNHWVNHVKELPIKRPVEIRAGRKFTAENLESIYEPSDAKGAKWLGCYIQATGEVQGQPCHTCVKPVGVFKQCVILGGDEFPRCGNCEWNRQGCHGASLLPKTKSNAGSQVVESPAKGKAKAAQVPTSTGGFTPVNSSASGQKARSPAAEDDDDTENKENKEGRSGRRKPSATPSQAKPAGRKSLPSGSSQRSQALAETPGATTPMTGSPDAEGSNGSDDLLNINKSVIEFEDDGLVFTKPKFMEGVPLAKIDADHAYWEADWTPLEEHIAANLKKWRDKLDHHNSHGSAPSSKFLANRQVNRGNAILKFLEEGELHPYQIVGKEFVNKQLASYDTVFRMVQVLEELCKFQKHIDITPSQWLRHRLYEVWQEDGAEFNLAKTVHDLYHDPKVSALRAKSGFGNIGRPSGYRMEKGETAKRASRGSKRKEMHSTPKATPQRRKSASEPEAAAASAADANALGPEPQAPVAASPNQSARPRSSHRKSGGVSAAADQQLQQHIQKEESKAEHPSPREHKKVRLLTNVTAEVEEAEDIGYTSSDSYSGDHVMQVDWRVLQVKHEKISTNTVVTQYWHWVDRADGGSEENMFEHQVLKDVLPKKVTWGVYKEPYDFHLRLPEVTEVTYTNDTDENKVGNKVIIGTKEIDGVVWRGDVLVAFKRDRTKRRFLAFIKKKGIKLVKTNKEYINDKWDGMQTDILPHYDSD